MCDCISDAISCDAFCLLVLYLNILFSLIYMSMRQQTLECSNLLIPTLLPVMIASGYFVLYSCMLYSIFVIFLTSTRGSAPKKQKVSKNEEEEGGEQVVDTPSAENSAPQLSSLGNISWP